MPEVTRLGGGWPGVSLAPAWAQALPHTETATIRSILSSREALVSWDLGGGGHGQKQAGDRRKNSGKGPGNGRVQKWGSRHYRDLRGQATSPLPTCPIHSRPPRPTAKPARASAGRAGRWLPCALLRGTEDRPTRPGLLGAWSSGPLRHAGLGPGSELC